MLNDTGDALSDEKGFPEVLKRIVPHRFFPLQEINVRKEYYLSRFIAKLLKSPYKLRIKEGRVKNLWLHSKDLHNIFHNIALIVSRINQDGAGINRMEELYRITHSRSWTDSEEEEIQNLDHVVGFFLLDIKSLLIFIVVFMDKLARFLSLIVDKKGKNLKNRSFKSFASDLTTLTGKKIEEFKRLISENTKWFRKVKDWRDDFVVHHPGASGAMIYGNDVPYAALTTRKKISGEPKMIIMGSQATYIPIEELDKILLQLKRLLIVLEEYLSGNINILPIEVNEENEAIL